MKIALITDTHFGVRKDSHIFYKHQEKFYDKIFFPYLNEHNIKTVVHLGDTFERRTSTNSLTLKTAKQIFFNKIQNEKIEYHAIVGNHDSYFNDDNSVNTPNLLLGEYDMKLYKDPTILDFDGTKILLVPWVTKDNIKKLHELLEDKNIMVVLGHLEINGFEMSAGKLCEKGLEGKVFRDIPLVLSGHFHKKAKNGNIQYLGNPYETEWGDYGHEKGFHILDTQNLTLEFIKNPYNVFMKIKYDEDKDYHFVDGDVRDKYIKIIIQNRKDFVRYEKFEEIIKSFEPYQLTIDDYELIQNVGQSENINIEAEDTPTIMKKYVEEMDDIHVRKEKLTEFLLELYKDANHIQEA